MERTSAMRWKSTLEIISNLDFITNFESFVSSYDFFKALGQSNVSSYVILQSRNSIISQNKPNENENSLIWEIAWSLADFNIFIP